MPLVHKCDICGKIYDISPIEKHVTMKFDQKGCIHEELCCCPECTRHITQFVTIMRDYPDRWTVHVSEESLYERCNFIKEK